MRASVLRRRIEGLSLTRTAASPAVAANQASGGPNGDAPGATSSTSELSQLLDEILAFLGRYIVFPNNDAAVAVTLWIVHSWVFDCFEETPYLYVSSPVKRCGKTRVLKCLSNYYVGEHGWLSPLQRPLFFA